MSSSGDQLRTIIDTISTLVWSANADGAADFLNGAGSITPACLRSKRARAMSDRARSTVVVELAVVLDTRRIHGRKPLH
jgi:hypothetical protein